MTYVQAVTKLFCLESSDNYLSDNKAYNKCCKILFKATIDNPIKLERNIKPSLPEFKDKVRNKLSILLKDVDLTVDHMNSEEFDEYKNNISLLEENKRKISVFDLSIIFGSCDMTRRLVSTNFTDLELLPILTESIQFDYHEYSDDIASEYKYVHEIGHILSQREKKPVKNFMHLEYAPVVLELFYAYLNGGEDTLNDLFIDRISSTLKNLSSNLTAIEHQYIISQLLGFQTIEKYIDFSTQQKEEMSSRFRECLSSNIQAETFMEDYDIGFQDKKSSIKYFKKTMKRVGIR